MVCYTVVFMGVSFWIAGAFITATTTGEIGTYVLSAILMFGVMSLSFGAFKNIKYARMVFAILFGGGLYLVAAFLTRFVGFPDLAGGQADWIILRIFSFLGTTNTLLVFFGALLALAFIFSGIGRNIRRRIERQVKIENKNKNKYKYKNKRGKNGDNYDENSVSSANSAADIRYFPLSSASSERSDIYVRDAHGNLLTEDEYLRKQATARNYK